MSAVLVPDYEDEFTHLKVPPHSNEAEQSVIGGLLLKSDKFYDIQGIVEEAFFYRQDHQLIFRSMKEVIETDGQFDLITLHEWLKDRDELENAGGLAYLGTLAKDTPSAANIVNYAKIVAKKYQFRQLISIGTEIADASFNQNHEPSEIIQSYGGDLDTVLDSDISQTIDMSELTRLTYKAIEENLKNSESKGMTGIPTGWAMLDKRLGGLQKKRVYVVAGRPGSGKCLGKGTKVVLFDGTHKNIEDVVVGDQLMGDDSTPRNVLSLAKGMEEMFLIKQKRGMDYRVNKSHILSLQASKNGEYGYKNGDVINIPVHELLEKSKKYQNNLKGYKSGFELPEKPISLCPYFLGVWLGDGDKRTPRITNPDFEIKNYLKEYANKLNMNLSEYKHPERCLTLTITRKKGTARTSYIKNNLRELNLLGNKHIPDSYLLNSRENRLKLLAGLIDTDGSLNNSGFDLIQKSKRLSNQIVVLCNSLGFRTSISKCDKSIKSIDFTGSYYRIYISGEVDKIPTKIKRKQASNPKNNNYQRTGIELVSQGMGEYYGFTLDGNRLFLLEDGTVTHNTAFSNQIAVHASTTGSKVGILSLEMGAEELGFRMLSHFYQVSGTRLLFGNKEETIKLKQKISSYKSHGKKLLTDADLLLDTDTYSLAGITAVMTQWKRKHGLDLLILDHIGLVENSGNSRNDSVGEVSRTIKKMAKRLDIAILELVQLNRENVKNNRRPQESDLRDSGSIEQDADVIIFLHVDDKTKGDEIRDLDIGLSKVRYGIPGWIPEVQGGPPFGFEGQTQTIREKGSAVY